MSNLSNPGTWIDRSPASLPMSLSISTAHLESVGDVSATMEAYDVLVDGTREDESTECDVYMRQRVLFFMMIGS